MQRCTIGTPEGATSEDHRDISQAMYVFQAQEAANNT